MGILIAPIKWKFTMKNDSGQPGNTRVGAMQIDTNVADREGAPQFSQQLAQLSRQNERLSEQMSALHASISTRKIANEPIIGGIKTAYS